MEAQLYSAWQDGCQCQRYQGGRGKRDNEWSSQLHIPLKGIVLVLVKAEGGPVSP